MLIASNSTTSDYNITGTSAVLRYLNCDCASQNKLWRKLEKSMMSLFHHCHCHCFNDIMVPIKNSYTNTQYVVVLRT